MGGGQFGTAFSRRRTQKASTHEKKPQNTKTTEPEQSPEKFPFSGFVAAVHSNLVDDQIMHTGSTRKINVFELKIKNGDQNAGQNKHKGKG